MTKKFLLIAILFYHYGLAREPRQLSTINLFSKIKPKPKKSRSCCATTTCDSVDSVSGPAPIIITAPGKYCLSQDITVTNSIGFFIAPASGELNNVELDLNNHTITLMGSSVGIQIENANQVSIKNGTIRGTMVSSIEDFPVDIGDIVNTPPTQIGIWLIGTEEVCISNLTISNTSIGILAIPDFTTPIVSTRICNSLIKESIFGIALAAVGFVTTPAAQVHDTFIEKTQVINNFDTGIFLGPIINKVTIRDSFINNNRFFGLQVADQNLNTDNVTIENTTFSNHSINGIFARSYSRNWFLDNCQFSNNTGNGIQVEGTQNFKIANSKIIDSGIAGRYNGLVITGRSSNSITIENCEILNAHQMALRIDNATGVTVKDSNILNYINTQDPAMRLEDIANASIINCRIASLNGNPFSSALTLRSSSGLLIDKSQIESHGNQASALLLNGDVINTKIRNTIINNTTISNNKAANGIAIVPHPLEDGSGCIVIEDSLIGGAFSNGILLQDTVNTTIKNNQICSTLNGPGINLENTNNIAIFNNVLVGNSKGNLHAK